MSTPIRRQAMEGAIRPGSSWTVTRTFTEEETLSFGDMIRDYNPVHYDGRFSEAKNFRGRILHGLLTAGLICEIGGQIGWLASSMDFSFKRPVYFGDSISCRLTVLDVDGKGYARASAVFTNQRGENVMEATLSGFLPQGPEQEILKKMAEEGDPSNKLARRSASG